MVLTLCVTTIWRLTMVDTTNTLTSKMKCCESLQRALVRNLGCEATRDLQILRVRRGISNDSG